MENFTGKKRVISIRSFIFEDVDMDKKYPGRGYLVLLGRSNTNHSHYWNIMRDKLLDKKMSIFYIRQSSILILLLINFPCKIEL